MQFVRYAADGPPQWGCKRNDAVIPLSGMREEFDIQRLTDRGFLSLAKDAVDAATDQAIPIDEVRIFAPVPRPGKIVCVGLNYHDHAEEQNEEVPDAPLLFGKAPTSVTNPNDPIVHPEGIKEVDYEVEHGVVIGRTAKNVDASDARDHVAGYTVINDVSGRDAQFEDEQFLRGILNLEQDQSLIVLK